MLEIEISHSSAGLLLTYGAADAFLPIGTREYNAFMMGYVPTHQRNMLKTGTMLKLFITRSQAEALGLIR